ncbi:hypothetical protein NQ314_001514 [Rhamnusium bicolor]|uniref:G-protein coupled receptors family 1 profile domain-containing protein n=1 Tax=Rhamnusium bicolor TaxID=1586634 RepID=A0AAV8ZSF4_9CUCU|nr:hypothetical protein NQ314_001514 [Rhamnusium bicolor]
MTPNLKISLSLAIADAVSSSMTGLMLFLDEIGIAGDMGVFPCIIELIRLSGIVITVLHLLALSLNHYIGIMKPLHYNSIVTKRKVSIAIAFLWICPIILLLILCTIESRGILFRKYKEQYKLRNQQNKWKNLSRLGSTRNKGRHVNGCSSSQKANREQVRLQGNIKAINTTLLILGSCFIGWMPALLFFILMCRNDCPINGETLNTLNQDYKYEVMTLRLIDNMLVIMKMLANPIIYTIRIKEIKDSTHRMFLAITGIFCPSRRNNNAYSIAYQSSRKQNSVVTSQIRMTSFRNNPTESQVI